MTEWLGKTVFITGASRGIGAATASAFCKAGVRNFFLHYNSNREGIEGLAAELRKAGSEVNLLQADLTLQAGIDSLIRDFLQLSRRVDILINNAGSLVQRARIEEVTSDLFDQVLNLNTKSMYFITQAVVPGMVGRGGGQIVNLSSIAARNGGGLGAAVYAASKAAVACLTKGLARELAPKGIRVNAVSPGTVDNDFHVQFSTRQMLDNVIAQTPAGRLGTNNEIADAVLFLCSDSSIYIHGQTIEINGGMYMV